MGRGEGVEGQNWMLNRIRGIFFTAVYFHLEVFSSELPVLLPLILNLNLNSRVLIRNICNSCVQILHQTTFTLILFIYISALEAIS